MNYLPDAVRHGAVIFTKCAVDHLSRDGGRWLSITNVSTRARRRRARTCARCSAQVVILAGGALGSTEVLLRSQGPDLQLSPALGAGFTGNGDVLGFGYKPEPGDRRHRLGTRSIGSPPPGRPLHHGDPRSPQTSPS